MFLFIFLYVSFFVLPSTFQATSPPKHHYVNEGTLSQNIGEFDSAFRLVNSFGSSRFGLYFFCDLTESNYMLGIGLGSPPKWVWAANRNNLVDDGATLSLNSDGNLILADTSGRVVWQTNTAHKGVTGLKLLENGNLVLHNAEHMPIWQSFDYPTDTLLPGQRLRPSHRLVSRASIHSSLEGRYNLIMAPQRVSLYYKSKSGLNIVPYYLFFADEHPSVFKELKFSVRGEEDQVCRITLDYSIGRGEGYISHELAQTNYNSSWSFLRLDYDGNLRVYSYYERPKNEGVWTREFTLFERDNYSPSKMRETECQLPERCGSFGVCAQDQCVACPSPEGLRGWRKSCAPPKLVGCGEGKGAKYYKMGGVEHFSAKYSKGEGPMAVSECETLCTNDCKCLGYFYHEDGSRCWLADDLKTLTLSDNNRHTGYVKMSYEE